MDCSMPEFLSFQLPELSQTHVHRVCDAIKPSHLLLPISPLAFNLSQYQGIFQWVSSIMSWQSGDKVETIAGFIFLGSKITADSDWSHEIKRHLPLGRKVMTNLDSILKIRDIILPTKVCLANAMVFPVVTYGCESWTIKRLSAKESMLLNCGVGEDSWESPGLQGDPTSQS